jgi:peptidoglycan/xylan/chitin deacetylase (PgdA/CDA1 family)
VLKQHHLTCTFFLTASWVEQNPDLARRIAAEGHEIGNHSYNHPDMTTLTREEMLAEVPAALGEAGPAQPLETMV